MLFFKFNNAYFQVQRGVVPIPKSVRKNRVEENIDVFDIELTKEEMETLSKRGSQNIVEVILQKL